MTQNFRSVYSMTILIVVFLIVFAGLFCFFAPAHAQVGAGVSIRPAIVDDQLDPGTVKEYSMNIENTSGADVTYYFFARNIKGITEGGRPVFATNNERTGLEIADWITISTSSMVIPANQSRSIQYIVSVPDNASPGSHIGGVFVSVDPPDIDTVGAAVAYQVGCNVIIRVSGEIVEQGNIRQFSTGKFLYSKQEVDFSVRIENSGNVLIRPSGPLEIYNMLGRKIDTITFNEENKAVFPYDTREFSNVMWVGNGVGFGRYEARLTPAYGEQGGIRSMSSTVTFWILPMNIIGPALLALLVILGIVFFFVRLYIRRSLEQMSRGHRLVSRRRRRNSSATLLLVVVMLTTTAIFLIVLLALFA